MAVQTSQTGSLEFAQNTVIAQARFTAESQAPCKQLIENFTLAKGQSTLRVPKVGQSTMENLTEGIDIVTEQDIGLSYKDLTTGEVGGKFILTRKLVEQMNEDVYKMIGTQLGDGMARKVDRDIIALFSALNAGTTLGADNATLGIGQASACIIRARAKLYPNPISVVHGPAAIGNLAKSAAAIGATYYAGILGSLSEELLRNFFKIQIDGVNFFWDANIDKINAVDSGYGAIFSKSAMAILTGWAPEIEREKDISLRATEVVMTSDYGVLELDDAYGAPMRYEIGSPVTT